MGGPYLMAKIVHRNKFVKCTVFEVIGYTTSVCYCVTTNVCYGSARDFSKNGSRTKY